MGRTRMGGCNHTKKIERDRARRFNSAMLIGALAGKVQRRELVNGPDGSGPGNQLAVLLGVVETLLCSAPEGVVEKVRFKSLLNVISIH